MKIKNLFLLVLTGLLLVQVACGSDSALTPDENENVELGGGDEQLPPAATNDADGDGVLTSCDLDDTDATVTDIKDECDDPDFDGFANMSCKDVADADADGIITQEERDALGVNCDVCPENFDPDQLDSDRDGVGDLCSEPACVMDLEGCQEECDPTVEDCEGQGGDECNEETGENCEPDEQAPEILDTDGDGLFDTVDPEFDKPNRWGYINAANPQVKMALIEPLFANVVARNYIEAAAEDFEGDFEIPNIANVDPADQDLLKTVAGASFSRGTRGGGASRPWDEHSSNSKGESTGITHYYFEYGIYIFPSGAEIPSELIFSNEVEDEDDPDMTVREGYFGI